MFYCTGPKMMAGVLSCFLNVMSIKNIERKAYRARASARESNLRANSFCVLHCNSQVNFREWKASRFTKHRICLFCSEHTAQWNTRFANKVYSTSER